MVIKGPTFGMGIVFPHTLWAAMSRCSMFKDELSGATFFPFAKGKGVSYEKKISVVFVKILEGGPRDSLNILEG